MRKHLWLVIPFLAVPLFFCACQPARSDLNGAFGTGSGSDPWGTGFGTASGGGLGGGTGTGTGVGNLNWGSGSAPGGLTPTQFFQKLAESKDGPPFPPPVPAPPAAKSRLDIGMYYDFGGMFGGMNGGYYNNPITNAPTCPLNYYPSLVSGTKNLDWWLVFCFKIHQDGVDPQWDFGGMFGMYWNGGHAALPNPPAGAPYCPAGYTQTPVSGTTNLDYPIWICWREHPAGDHTFVKFGGMWGYHYNFDTNTHDPYVNPATNGATCPKYFFPALIRGTPYLDYPVIFCWRPYSDEET